MDRKKIGAIEIARVSLKVKKPHWKKTVLTLMSDGSVWERIAFKKRSEKIKSEWSKVNQFNCPKYTREMFLRIFTGAGWKQKGV